MTPTMFSMQGKTALVTGGAQGIGRGIVEVFLAAGAQVYFCDMNAERGEATAVELSVGGARANFVQADITDRAQVAAFVDKALESGRIDVLVNNASYTSGAQHAVIEATEEEWLSNFRVGLLGTQFCTAAVLPSMMIQKSGSVIVISSIQAVSGCPASAPYSSVKAAQLGFVKSAAHDYGPHGVRVNAICPGPIRVDYSPRPGSPGYDYQVAHTMLGRVGNPEDIGYAALFLAADESSFVTGATLMVDGGWTAK